MSRRCLSLVVVFVLVAAELMVLMQPAAAADNIDVEVRPWTCTAAVDLATTDQAAFTAACPDVASGVRITVKGGDVQPRGRNTSDTSQVLSWGDIDSPITIEIVQPTDNEPAVVFCRIGDGAPELILAPTGELTREVPSNSKLSCEWYRLPEAVPAATSTPTPTSTPRPSNTPNPTSTPRPTNTPNPSPTPSPSPTATTQPPTPSPTSTPTATVRPSATPAPSPAASPTPAATPTPTEVPLPEPIDTGPPEMFRGDPSHTGRQAEPGPDGDPVLLWRYPIGSTSVSSPVYAAGMVYIGADTGVFAINARTGTVLWHFETELPVTASPAVVGGVVYVGGEDGLFYAIDAGTGVQRWVFETRAKIRSSPVVDDGVIYFSSYDGSVYALEAATGEARWVNNRVGDDMISSPAVANGMVYIGTGDFDGGALVVLEAETGKEVWSYRTIDTVASSPTILNGIIYFGADDGRLHAADMDDEDQRLCIYPDSGQLRPIRSSPAALDGVIIFAVRFRSMYAVNSTTCELIWEFDGASNWIDSSPAVAGGTIYVGSKDANLYAVNASDGTLRWSYLTDGAILSSPVVGNGVVYVASRDGFLYAIAGSDNEGDLVPPPGDSAALSDIPRELLIDGAHYRYDRVVPVDRESLERFARIGQTQLYAREDRTEDSPIYASRPSAEGEEDESQLIRYLPELVGVDQPTCAALTETDRPFVTVRNNGADIQYAFAGVEPDLTPDDLSPLPGDTSLGTIYVSDQEAPYGEIFFEQNDQLVRYQLLDDSGVPAALGQQFPFAGQLFEFAADVTEDTDLATLAWVGCSGAYPVVAVSLGGAAPPAPYDRIYSVIAGRVLAFDPVAPPSAEASRAAPALARQSDAQTG